MERTPPRNASATSHPSTMPVKHEPDASGQSPIVSTVPSPRIPLVPPSSLTLCSYLKRKSKKRKVSVHDGLKSHSFLDGTERDSGTSQPSASRVQPEPDADDLLLRELTSFSWVSALGYRVRLPYNSLVC